MALSSEELVAALTGRFPEDSEDLRQALEVFQAQRLTSCDRLAKLNDSQWQRLGLPIGIETILRDAVAAAAESPSGPRTSAALSARRSDGAASQKALARAKQHSEGLPTEEGLRHRHGGGATREARPGNTTALASPLPVSANAGGPEQKGLLDLTPPPELDLMWQQLLEDTLPPDKRNALQETWKHTASDQDRYMLFLEYSSYLRKTEINEEERAERRKQLEPLMKELGVRPDEDEATEYSDSLMWCVLITVILFLAGVVHYAYTAPAPLHDDQAL